MAFDWTSLFWLGLVLLAIPAVLWLLKRTPLGQGGAAGTARTVAVLPLSTTQRVVTIEIGHGEERLWLVLGVTPQNISNLYTMAPQATPPGFQSPEATLNPLLQRLRRRSEDGNAF